jgi:16S rRNA (adenine1518-N6/adenine1519-N6)-dimethyltransferase
VHYLRNRFREHAGLSVLHQDVLKTDLRQFGPAVVAGNLPYYITSPILEQVFAAGDMWQSAVFLVQKEVAERVTARPGSRDYGYLSVQTQLYAQSEILFDVPRGAFRPPPKVESAVFRLTPRPVPLVRETRQFLKFASMCFRQKRKTLRNNLLPCFDKDVLAAQPEAGLRAEQLGLEQLADLWRRLSGSEVATGHGDGEQG